MLVYVLTITWPDTGSGVFLVTRDKAEADHEADLAIADGATHTSISGPWDVGA